MLAVDTNVIVRLVLDDDRAQAKIARQTVARHEVWLAVTVLLETEWVLRAAAKLDRQHIHFILTEVLGLPTVRVESPARVAHALAWFGQGMDFADALHLAACADGDEFATFDRKLVSAARKAKAGKVRAL